MMAGFKRIWDSEEGVAAIEYALIATLVAVAIVGALALLGTSLNRKYVDIGTDIYNAFN